MGLIEFFEVQKIKACQTANCDAGHSCRHQKLAILLTDRSGNIVAVFLSCPERTGPLCMGGPSALCTAESGYASQGWDVESGRFKKEASY
jgi:hypothetical protein